MTTLDEGLKQIVRTVSCECGDSLDWYIHHHKIWYLIPVNVSMHAFTMSIHSTLCKETSRAKACSGLCSRHRQCMDLASFRLPRDECRVALPDLFFRDRKSCRKWKRNKALKYGLPAVVWSNYWLAGGWGLIKNMQITSPCVLSSSLLPISTKRSRHPKKHSRLPYLQSAKQSRTLHELQCFLCDLITFHVPHWSGLTTKNYQKLVGRKTPPKAGEQCCLCCL